MPLTDHQELAAESRGGARLVSAAAGSGKTKVLVERLMRYVDRGADIDQFLSSPIRAPQPPSCAAAFSPRSASASPPTR